jgi:hypothetical protein
MQKSYKTTTQLKVDSDYNMSIIQGKTAAGSSPLDIGLFGKRFNGYFADAMNWWDTAVLHGDTNTTTSINNFTSNADLYSWMWIGYFKPNTTGTYTFFTTSDDASYLWIGPTAVTGFTTANATVNNGGLHGTQERSGTITLQASIFYPIRIMFGENFGGDIMIVAFTPPGASKTTNGLGFYFGGKYAWDAIIQR